MSNRGFQVQDALLQRNVTLPNGAATTNTTSIDLEQGVQGEFLADAEVLIDAPALTTGELGDTQTITYSIRQSANADFSNDTELLGGLILQTGAGGAGAAAAQRRVRLPSTTQRYIRLRAVKTGASNASTKSGSIRLVF
jgi:hypothetical protein